MKEVDRFKPYELSRAFQLGLQALGRRYTHREVAARLGNHLQPGSMLAVADLAASFGAEITAVRCDLDDLDAECVPMMLQLQSGTTSGFAIVTAVADDSFSVLDTRGAPLVLSRLELGGLATGVTVFLNSSPGSGSSERGYLLNRLRDLAADFGARFSECFPAFSGIGGGMRLLSLAILAMSVVLALTDSSSPEAGLFATGLTAVVAVGALLSLALLMISRNSETAALRLPLSWRLCTVGGPLDCDSVLHSRWASIGPWPLASLGAAWFLSLLATFGWAGTMFSTSAGEIWLALSLLFASPISLLLVLVQAWPLKKICSLCMTIHLAVFAGAFVSWQLLAAWLPPTSGQLANLWPVGLLQLWFFSLVLGVLMPWIKDSADLATLTGELDAATATPLGSLALTLASPPLAVPIGPELMSWGNSQATLRIDGFVNPLCPSCGPVLSELFSLAQSRGDRLRVVIHLAEKSGASDRSLLLGMMAIAIVRGYDAALEAFWTIKNDPEQWLRAASSGAGMVGARLSGCRYEEIDDALPAARHALDSAASVARAARSGLPFVLLAGRRFSAAVKHLDFLVGSHYSLLLESLGLNSDASAGQL